MTTNLPSAATRYGFAGPAVLASAAIVAVGVAGIQGVFGLTERGLLLFLMGTSVLSVFGIGAVLAYGTRRELQLLQERIEPIADGRSPPEQSLPAAFDAIDDHLEAIEGRLDDQRSEIDRLVARRDDLEAELQTVDRTTEQYERTISDCVDGDLSRRLTPPDDHEGLAAVASAFNEFVGTVQEAVDDIESGVTQVATTSRSMADDAVTVKSASDQINRSMQRINEGADEQSEALSTVTKEMEGLSTTTEEIAASSNEVADIAERTSKTGREGREAAQTAIAGMNEIKTKSSSAVEQIEQLETEVNQIDGLIDQIQEVASQTNMLALNANIEASRSGQRDDGKGFGVVAEEVKDLSADAKAAAEEIEERLASIQEQTSRSADEVESTAERIEAVTGSVEGVVGALDEIATYAERTNEGVQEISAATEQQAASTQEVVSIVAEASSISEETSDEADNVAAATADQAEAIGSFTDNAGQITERANRLADILEQFGADADAIAVEVPEGTSTSQRRAPTAQSDRDLGSSSSDRGTSSALDDLELSKSPSDSPDATTSPTDEAGRPDSTHSRVGDPAQADATGSDTTGDGADAAPVDVDELREAVIDAYPGDQPPWHALARIQLKTGYDLENAAAEETIPADQFDHVLEAAEEVTGREIDIEPAATEGSDAGAADDSAFDFGIDDSGTEPTEGSESDAASDGVQDTAPAAAVTDRGSDADPLGDPEAADVGGAESVDAYELKQRVIDAYPGDEPPWHALARIQLKTNYDLEDAEPGDELPTDRRQEIVRAAREVTDTDILLQQ